MVSMIDCRVHIFIKIQPRTKMATFKVLTAICKWFTNLTEFIWSTNFFAVFQQWLARHSMFVHITFDQGWQRAKPMQWGHKLEKNFNWLVTIFESCFASFFDFMIKLMSQMDANAIRWSDSSKDIAQIKTLMKLFYQWTSYLLTTKTFL